MPRSRGPRILGLLGSGRNRRIVWWVFQRNKLWQAGGLALFFMPLSQIRQKSPVLDCSAGKWQGGPCELLHFKLTLASGCWWGDLDQQP